MRRQTMHIAFCPLLGILLSSPAYPLAASGQEAPPERTERFTFEVGNRGSLGLSNISGDIVVRAIPGTEIRIEATKRAHGRDAERQLERIQIQVSHTGDRVRVHTAYPGGDHRRNRVAVDYSVGVPGGTSVRITSVSGSIELEGVQGEAQVETVSGDVQVSRAEHLLLAKSVSGDVTVQSVSSPTRMEISSVSGDVRVTGLKAASVEVGSVSGDVYLDQAASERATLKSVSGDLRYEGSIASAGRYEFKTHSGDVEIVIPDSVGFELEARTFSGEIETAIPLTVDALRERRSLSGVFGDGGAFIDASTFSGDITLVKK